jgi:glycosidase
MFFRHGMAWILPLLAAPNAFAAGILEVRAPGYEFQNGEYTTSHVFIDEIEGSTAPIEIKFTPGFPQVTDVEVFTNLNRRDLARMDKNGDGYPDGIVPVDGNSITDAPADTDAATGHYFAPVNLADGDNDGTWEGTIEACRTGAYRLTARFKVSNAIAENGFNPSAWIWYGLRDHCVVVSPVDARTIRLYEINVFNIEADGDTFTSRSTFEDLHNAPGAAHNANNRWDLTYLKNLGANWLWFQPIHPNGIDGREPSGGWGSGTPPYDPGSPYAVKNFFEVNPLMTIHYDGSKTEFNGQPINPTMHPENRAAAKAAFQAFVTAADSESVGIMLDAPFNHTAFDVELAQQGIERFQPDGETWSPLDEIRNREARFFSKDYDEFNNPGGENYAERASNAGELAPGPDRFDFRKWNDVKDVFFGRYDALVEYDAEPERSSYTSEGDWFDTSDAEWTSNDFVQEGQWRNVTRRVWDYFADYAVHWLEVTRPPGQNRNSASEPGLTKEQRRAWDGAGIDGLRCDFGQGLPPQCWEYIINVARSYKWNFVMMSESLDGGAVTYRSSRHFDILNENIVFPLKSASTTYDYRNIFEARRGAYGQGLVLINSTSHDEENFVDPWEALIRYSVAATLDGAPLIFPGQELGLSYTYGYQHYESNFDKQIPHFKRWNSMLPLWSDANFGNDQLYPVYAGLNAAREHSPALVSSNRWFLDGDGANSKIYAVAKYETPNASPAVSDVVLAFANLDRDSVQADNFKIPAPLAALLGLEDGRTYNVRNIAAYTKFDSERRSHWQWGSGYTGAQLKASGFFVSLPKVPTTDADWMTAPFEGQYLRVYDITAPVATPAQPAPPNTYPYVIGDSVTFSWNAIAADPAGIVPHYAVDVIFNGNPAGTHVTSGTSFSVPAAPGDTVSVSIRAVNPHYPQNTGPASVASVTVKVIASEGDDDGDGQTNLSEHIAGTNPLDPGSLLRVVDTGHLGDSHTIEWTAVPGRIYQVWATNDLNAPFAPLSDPLPANSPVEAYTDATATGIRRFYRVIVIETP